MVPSTTPKISSGTTLEKFETGSAEKIFQGGIKVYKVVSLFTLFGARFRSIFWKRKVSH